MLDPISGAGASFCAVIHRVRFCAFSCRLFFIFPSSARPPLSLRFFFCGKCEKGNIFIVRSAERSAIDNPQQSAALCSINCATKDQQVRALMIGFIFIKMGSDRIGLDRFGLDGAGHGHGARGVTSPQEC